MACALKGDGASAKSTGHQKCRCSSAKSRAARSVAAPRVSRERDGAQSRLQPGPPKVSLLYAVLENYARTRGAHRSNRPAPRPAPKRPAFSYARALKRHGSSTK